MPTHLIVMLQVLVIASTVISLASPYLYSLLVDEVMTNGNVNLLYQIIPAMIGIFIIQIAFSALSTFVSIKYINVVNLEVKTKLFNRLMSQDLVNAINIDVGMQQKLIEEDGSAITNFFIGHIAGFITAFLYSAIYLMLMFLISPWLSFVAIVFIPLIIIFGKCIGKKFNVMQHTLWQIGSKNNSFLFDSIQKWREIKVKNLEKQYSQTYDDKLQPERKTLMGWILYYALNDVFYDIKNGFVNNVLMYFLGGVLIINGHMTIGALLMFMSYMSNLSKNIDYIVKSVTDFTGSKATYDRLFHELEYEDRIKEIIGDDNLDVSIENLTFSYQTALPDVLTNVSYKFSYGKKYLLIGKSGEGKSTLIKLLLCMALPNQGVIRLSNKDLRIIKQPCLFRKLTAVMQENQFFNMSIRDNLLLIAPEATNDQIDFACETADIYDYIQSLPYGYDTIIGERGIKLSGGQKQRLAIARLILHNPKIAILDEATSSLDAITEKKILCGLNELFKNRTLIVISHKPALHIDFDEIISVEHNTLNICGIK